MSQLASFYTLPKDRFDDLVVAATPRVVVVEKRRFFWKRQVEELVYGYWEFLREVAREQEDCPYPGGMFSDLDLVLEPRGCKLFDLARRDLADRLSKAKDLLPPARKPGAWPAVLRSAIPVFDHAAADTALVKLNDCGFTEKEARDYARENYPAEDEDPATSTLIAVFDLSKRWLALVGRDEIGVLNVG